MMPAPAHSGVEAADVLEAESPVIVGSKIGKAIAFERFVLAAGLATESWTVSGVVRLLGATVALSCVELT